jgi:tRNA threonylcarbamoyladenosine biosynthesis protein TsaE
MKSNVHITQTPEETHDLGKVFGESLSPGSIIAFFGGLGVGKTTFIRGLVNGIGTSEEKLAQPKTDPSSCFGIRGVCSPTFTLLNIYDTDKKVFHFDLYRLPREEEFFASGFDAFFKTDGICCIEWAENIAASLPPQAFKVTLSHLGENARQIEIVRPIRDY